MITLKECKPGDWVLIGSRYARYCTTISGMPYVRWGGKLSELHEDAQLHAVTDLTPLPGDTPCSKILSGIKGF